MAGATPAPTTQISHVSATARSFPRPGLVPVAMVLAVAVGLLSLLPSLAAAVWEVPHLFVLGLVISYGVFTQRNTDFVDHQTGHCDGNGAKAEGALVRNALYRPDEPLIVVADHAASDRAREGAMERPVSLPVRRLKPPPAAATRESETSDDGVGEETDSLSASSAGGLFCSGAHTAPSPPSVLDADLGLSPCCSPQPQSSSPPFFAHSSTTESRGFSGYHYLRMPRDEALSEAEDGEVTDDWDDDEEVDDASDEMMTVTSERSVVRGDFTACVDNNDHNDDDDTSSVDEELLKLASKAAPKGEDEVDRKADEFIAKFREQIRLQRL